MLARIAKRTGLSLEDLWIVSETVSNWRIALAACRYTSSKKSLRQHKVKLGIVVLFVSFGQPTYFKCKF